MNLNQRLDELRQEFISRLEGLISKEKIRLTHIEVYFREDRQKWIARGNNQLRYKHLFQSADKTEVLEAAHQMNDWLSFARKIWLDEDDDDDDEE